MFDPILSCHDYRVEIYYNRNDVVLKKLHIIKNNN